MLILAYFFQCANFALAWICNTYSIIKGMFYIQYVTAWLLVISIFAICGRTVLSKFNLVVLLIIFRRCKNGNRTSVKVFTFEIHNTEGLQIEQAWYLASHISKKITGRTYYHMRGWHVIFIQFYVWRYFISSRHILAIIHFNVNLHRDVKLSQDGSGTPQVKVIYPKFKNGEATVKEVKVKQKFGKDLNNGSFRPWSNRYKKCHRNRI